MPVLLDRLGAKNAVVQDALHAVSVPAVLRGPHQVARQLEVRIRSARRLKTRMRLRQALADLTTPRHAEVLIRPPSTGRETLRSHKIKSVPRRPQILLIPQHKIRLHCTAHRIHVAVGMLARQHILSRCQRIPIPVVRKKAHPEILVPAARPSLPREKGFSGTV